MRNIIVPDRHCFFNSRIVYIDLFLKENEVDKEDLARWQPIPLFLAVVLGFIWQLLPHAMDSAYSIKDLSKSSVGGWGYFVDFVA